MLSKGKPLKWVTEYWLKLHIIPICLLNGMHKEFKRYQIRYIKYWVRCYRNVVIQSSNFQSVFFLFNFIFVWLVFVFVKNQSQTQPLLKTPPAVLQPIAPQTTFGVQAQPQPQSLLQAQISAASITPLLQTQPQPLLQQPQQKGITYNVSFLFQINT